MTCDIGESIREWLHKSQLVDMEYAVPKHNFSRLIESIAKIQRFLKDTLGVTKDYITVDPNTGRISFNEDALKGKEASQAAVNQLLNSLFDPKEWEGIGGNVENMITYKEELQELVRGAYTQLKSEVESFYDRNSMEGKTKEEQQKINEEFERLITKKNEAEARLSQLTAQIAELKKLNNLNRFNIYAATDLERLEKLVESDDPNDIMEANNIIAFFQAAGTFEVGENHPLFTDEELFKDGTPSLKPVKIIDQLKRYKEQADIQANILYEAEMRVVNNIFKKLVESNEELAAYYKSQGISLDNLIGSTRALRDISFYDMMFMDISNKLMTEDSPIPQMAMIHLQELELKRLAYSKKIVSRIEAIQHQVAKTLKDKGLKYEVFYAKNKAGQRLGTRIIGKYSTDFVDAARNMFNSFMSVTIGEPNEKIKRRSFAIRDKWLKDNTIMIDISKLSAVRDLGGFEEGEIQFDDVEIAKYEAELKGILGEKAFQNMVKEQLNALRAFRADRKGRLDFLKQKIKTRYEREYGHILYTKVEDITEPMSDTEKEARVEADKKTLEEIVWGKDDALVKNVESFKEFDSSYNPAHYYTDKKNKYFITKYTQYIPRATFDNGQSTGYYNEDFKTIEEDDTLYEFYKILDEVTDAIYYAVPQHKRKYFTADSLPSMKKSFMNEVAENKLLSMNAISKLTGNVIDAFNTAMAADEQNAIAASTVSKVTGVVNYRTNDSKLKAVKQTVNEKYGIIATQIKAMLGVSNFQAENLKSISVDDIKKKPEVIKKLASLIGVEPTFTAIEKYLVKSQEIKTTIKDETGEVVDATMDNSNIDLRESIYNALLNEESLSEVQDLPMLMKLFTHIAMDFDAKTKALPTIAIMKKYYEGIERDSRATKSDSSRKTLDLQRKNAIQSFNSWFERIILGIDKRESSQANLVNPKIKSAVKKVWEKYRKKAETQEQDNANAVEEAKAGNNPVSDNIWRAKTLEEKREINQITETIDELEKLKSTLDSDQEKEEFEKHIIMLKNKRAEIGSPITAPSIIMRILNFIRFSALGYNVPSQIMNYFQGQIANTILAASERYFPEKVYWRAQRLTKKAIYKNYGGNSIYRSKDATKLAALVAKWDILQDVSNELAKNSQQSNLQKLEKLMPYEMMKRIEYLNQVPIFLSVVMNTQVTGKDGTTTNLWDALDYDEKTKSFSMKENFATEENIKNFVNLEGEQFIQKQIEAVKLIINTHGDYHNLRGFKASEYIVGTITMMFRRWLPRAIFTRFAVKQADLEVGKVVKGRYRSLTKTTGALLGGVAGLVTMGPLGAMVGAGIGLGATMFGKNIRGEHPGIRDLNILQELMWNTLHAAYNIVRVPINMMVGGRANIEFKYTDRLGLSELDKANYKSNIQEIGTVLALFGMKLLTEALLNQKDDDDDEDYKGSAKQHMLFYFSNLFLSLASDTLQFMNPITMAANIFSNNGLIRHLTNAIKLVGAAQDALMGHDTITAGPNAGRSNLWIQSRKYLPTAFFSDGFGFGTRSSRFLMHSPWDNIGQGTEIKAKAEFNDLVWKFRDSEAYSLMTSSERRANTSKIKAKMGYIEGKKAENNYSDLLESVDENEDEIEAYVQEITPTVEELEAAKEKRTSERD